MKKLFKILLILAAVFVVLLLGALLALKIMFPMEKVKAQVQEQVKNKLNREVDFKSFSLSLRGLNISDFALSEKTTFKDGTFIFAKEAKAKIDLKALLHKQIKIETIGLDNFTLNIIKDKDGKFNFDDLTSCEEAKTDESEQTQTQSSMFEISAKQIYTKDATINYKDETSGTNFSINNLNIQIDNFDLSKEFSVLISCLSKIKTPALILDPVLFKTLLKVNLADLDLPKAKAEIENFSVTYDKTALKLSGFIADFSNPQLNLTGTLEGIDDKLLKNFTDGEITRFALPVINMILSAKINLENSLINISQAKASIGNSFIKTRANIDYSKEELSFSSNSEASISLDEVSLIAKETLAEFNLKGTITGNIEASQEKALKVKGKIDFKNIAAKFLKQDLQNTGGTITIKSLEDIYTNKISGLFGGEPWNLTLAYKKAKNTGIDLAFYMKKFTLEDINFETWLEPKKEQSKENKEEAKKEEKINTSTSDDLYNLKADINIGQIENNVLTANDFILKTDIKDFDLSLSKAQGELEFNTKDMEIRDIDKLMSTSKIFKVMFTSLKLMQKAFDFAKLDNSSITNGIIKCSLINGKYTLNDGVVNIIKSDIDSDLTIVKSSGKADLLNDSVDMQIQAQLGKTGSNGFKPVVIKIKGALSNPSYKVDVLSSLASILSKNSGDEESSASNQAKGVAESAGNMIKSIGSLFKKDK